MEKTDSKNNLVLNSDSVCGIDLLGHDVYVETLGEMIADKEFQTPFCIGIYGKWGSGKTTFMKLLAKKLEDSKSGQTTIPVWFNPWRYAKEEHLIIPFLKTIELSIKNYVNETKGTQGLKKILKNAAQKAGDAAAAISHGISGELLGLKFDAAKAIEHEKSLIKQRESKHQQHLENYRSLYYDMINQLKNTVDEKSYRITVFIDDLDRCLPETAVELLEAIKLFLDIKGYLFVIGAAQDVVEQGIAYRYRHLDENKKDKDGKPVINPKDYLDKMIQLPFELPPIESSKKSTYIESLIGENTEFKDRTDLIKTGIGNNPRELKRFVNLLAFTSRLAENLKNRLLAKPDEDEENKQSLKTHFIPGLYVKWSIIVFKFPDVHSDIKGNRQKLLELQDAAINDGKSKRTEDSYGKTDNISINENLKTILRKEPLFPNNDWIIGLFVHLTEAAKTNIKDNDAAAGYSQSFQPGDQVLIAKGIFLYGDDKIEKMIDYDYYIDVFPVTNRQYKAFLDDPKNKNHPIPKVDDDWAKPYNWSQTKDGISFPKDKDNHPAVLVNYDDAVAYCKWRTETEKDEYRLPTEEEWEKAARGIDGRVYPWGDEFATDKCNTKKSGIETTSDVTKYRNGTGPNKCYDMAGNVWEWTESWYDNGKDFKVLRGGSWGSSAESARCASRNGNHPNNRDTAFGFRCARTLN